MHLPNLLYTIVILFVLSVILRILIFKRTTINPFVGFCHPWPKKQELSVEEMVDEYRELANILDAIFTETEKHILPGVTTAELDAIAAKLITEAGVQSCFKGYNDYPAHISASVDAEVINTPPSTRKLASGQILSMQIGIMNGRAFSYQGWSYAIGAVDAAGVRLMVAGHNALRAAVERAMDGVTPGSLSLAISQTARNAGFSVNRDFVGHRMGRELHELPMIPCHYEGQTAITPTLTEGMILSLQAIIQEGDWDTMVADNKWNVVTFDGKRAVQFSMIVVVRASRVQLLTQPRRLPIMLELA